MEHVIADLEDELPVGGRDLLAQYGSLLLERAVPRGFVARADADRLRERHILDSLRAVRCLRQGDRSIADVGSGAGLPGVPIAIACPDRHVMLIEPMARKAAFLELVVDELGMSNVAVVVSRVQEVRQRVHVCVARALADPPRSWALGAELLEPNGRLLYFAGTSWNDGTEAGLRSAGISASICDRCRFPGYGPVVIMRAMPNDRTARSASR